MAAGLTASLGAAPVYAQGVPVIDGSNLAKNIQQLQQALADADRQLQQIQQLQAQIQQLTDINGLLDSVLGSITGLNQIGDLYNTAADIRSRAEKITDLGGFMDSLAIGDFDGLIDSLLDGQVTMGDKMAAEAVEETLAGAGFTSDTLSDLSTSDNVSDGTIAQTAAANATAMAAAQMSYEESGESIERTSGLVDEIGGADTLKESVDLNTRMAAETNYMLGQMWRLNAAQGLASGQNGINWAAEQAKERSFFDFSGADD
ncbi:type IV secretion system protein [uncultured Aliiroseovarius sp.]|uniref:type IV secretion system protein n=1 Tax=uncultured Aliiroseovarius sp. TaxID=1658783 RepID=UPI002636D21E|nr:type IV secretion system protein [uncultured Aliiroseovarius sp.]